MENHNILLCCCCGVPILYGCAFFVAFPLFDNTANIVPYMIFHGNIFKNYSGIYGTVFVRKRI